MSEREPPSDLLSGRCLCGTVRFSVRPKHMAMDVCHCGQCRRWSGGAWMTVECEPESFAVEPADRLSVYASSDHAERGFCATCGTTLLWRMRDRSLLTVSAQAFEHPERFAFASEIFIDNKPANYAFANPTKKMTEAQVLAQFPEIAG
jgi:hypothetical protein